MTTVIIVVDLAMVVGDMDALEVIRASSSVLALMSNGPDRQDQSISLVLVPLVSGRFRPEKLLTTNVDPQKLGQILHD